MSKKFLAITGGPGAGKTTLLESLQKECCDHVKILPEAAGILFGGGFPRIQKFQETKKSSQRCIFHIQKEMQKIYKILPEYSVILCDRGTLDGLAYWPGTEEEFFREMQTTKEQEFAEYEAILHLRSPNDSNGYNYQNPLRIETSEEAKIIDEKIKNIWKSHPKYFEVSGQKHFFDKIQKSYEFLKEYLA